MVGASGAISGVLGAYIVLYPRVRVHTLIFLGFFVTTVALPAYVMLGYWFALQLLLGTAGAGARAPGGVAGGGPVAGVFAGVGLLKLFGNPALTGRRLSPHPREWGRRLAWPAW